MWIKAHGLCELSLQCSREVQKTHAWTMVIYVTIKWQPKLNNCDSPIWIRQVKERWEHRRRGSWHRCRLWRASTLSAWLLILLMCAYRNRPCIFSKRVLKDVIELTGTAHAHAGSTQKRTEMCEGMNVFCQAPTAVFTAQIMIDRSALELLLKP